MSATKRLMGGLQVGDGSEHTPPEALGAGDLGERIEAQVPDDNYATHKHPKVRRWLAQTPS